MIFSAGIIVGPSPGKIAFSVAGGDAFAGGVLNLSNGRVNRYGAVGQPVEADHDERASRRAMGWRDVLRGSYTRPG